MNDQTTIICFTVGVVGVTWAIAWAWVQVSRADNAAYIQMHREIIRARTTDEDDSHETPVRG